MKAIGILFLTFLVSILYMLAGKIMGIDKSKNKKD
jgi:hypothetical protein